MKRFFLSILLVLGLAQSSYADTLKDIQGHARQIIPSSRGLNKAVAGMVGTSEGKVQDLANTYSLPAAQWLLYKFIVHKTSIDATYKNHISGYLHIQELIYLGGITYSYIEEAVRTSNSAQLAAFGLNAVTGFLFIKWWHGKYGLN